MFAASFGVAPSGECLCGKGLVWLLGALMCLLAAPWVQLSVLWCGQWMAT